VAGTGLGLGGVLDDQRHGNQRSGIPDRCDGEQPATEPRLHTHHSRMGHLDDGRAVDLGSDLCHRQGWLKRDFIRLSTEKSASGISCSYSTWSIKSVTWRLSAVFSKYISSGVATP
jgi:hypothetical protein